MATAHRSRRTRVVAAPWIPPLAAILLACSGGDSKPSGTPPTIASLHLWPASVIVNDGGGAAGVGFGFRVSDPDADVARLVVRVLDGTGAEVGRFEQSVTNPPGATIGEVSGDVAIPTATVATFTVEVQAFDARSNASNVLAEEVAVVEGNPVPVIASLSPDSAQEGAAGFTLTVTGTGFVAGSTVLWNGYFLPTTYVDATTLAARVEGYQLPYTGTVQVVVTNPPPGGGTSAPRTFAIEPPSPRPVPTLTAVSPASVEALGPPFTLTVTGTGFVAGSSVHWNGSYLSTTFVDSSTLTATVPSYYVESPRTVDVTVYTPAPGGGTSSALTLTVTRPEQPGVTILPLKANDLAWDPYQRKIYASVPSSSGVNPNTVTALDPFTGALTASTWVGSEPDRLGISDDGQLLYVGLRGASSVERLSLPGLAPELSIGLGRDPTAGPYYAVDLQVAPASPRTLAVSLSTSSSYYSTYGALVVFDDATPRPTRAAPPTSYAYGSLQWGATADVLYATSSGYSNQLNALDVDATGVTAGTAFPSAFSSSVAIRFDAGTGLVYGEDGRAVDPATGELAGTFPIGGYSYSRRLVPDSSLGSAFVVRSDSYSGPHLVLDVFDLARFYRVTSTPLTFVGAEPRGLIRWGTDGVAFLTSDAVVLVRGGAVIPESPTANPAPSVTSVSPSSATAGASNLTVVVGGTGFVRGSTVLWNGSERTTRYVSATGLVAYVPASDVAAAGSAEISVLSPAPGGGISGAVTFTVLP